MTSEQVNELSANNEYLKKALSNSIKINEAGEKELVQVGQKAVKEFAEYLKEYAKACKESGYDGIGEIDIDEKLKEFLNK